MDLQEYKEKYPHLEERLTKFEKKVKIAEIIILLKENQGMKLLLKELENVINNINARLLSSDRIEVEEREKLLTDKERCMWLADVFGAQEQVIQNVNNYIKKL